MSGKLQVRQAGVADADSIAKVHVATWRTTYTGIVPDEYIAALSVETRGQFWRETLAHPNLQVVTLVAVDEKGIIGLVSGGPERTGELGADGELYAIYVLECAQGRGIGGQLFRALAGELRLLGLHSMALWALERNPFRGFYEKLGGRVVGEQTIAFGGQSLREVAYRWEALPLN